MTPSETYALPTFKRLWRERSLHLAGCVAVTVVLGVIGLVGFANMDFVFAPLRHSTGGPTEPVTVGMLAVPAAARFVAACVCSLAASLTMLHRAASRLCRETITAGRRQDRWEADFSFKLLTGTAALLGAVVGCFAAGLSDFSIVHGVLPLLAGAAAGAVPVGMWGIALAEEACWPKGCDSFVGAVKDALFEEGFSYSDSPAKGIWSDTWVGLWATGLPAATVAELLQKGRTPEQIIGAQRDGVPTTLDEGWL